MKNNNLKKGIAPLVIILIVALLASGGGATYLVVKGKPLSVDSIRENLLGGETKEEALEDLAIESADLDVSVSPIPKLELNALNLSVPEVAAPKIGNINTSFNANVSVDTSDVNLATPNLGSMMPQISIPSIPTGSNIPSGITIPTIPTGMPPLPTDMGGVSVPPSTGTVPPDAGAGSAPSIDCSAFVSVPSCTYIPAGQAQDACRSCFPNK